MSAESTTPNHANDTHSHENAECNCGTPGCMYVDNLAAAMKVLHRMAGIEADES